MGPNAKTPYSCHAMMVMRSLCSSLNGSFQRRSFPSSAAGCAREIVKRNGLRIATSIFQSGGSRIRCTRPTVFLRSLSDACRSLQMGTLSVACFFLDLSSCRARQSYVAFDPNMLPPMTNIFCGRLQVFIEDELRILHGTESVCG